MIPAVKANDVSPRAAPPAPNPIVNPKISRSLGADYEALKNDLDQAIEFTTDLQREVAVSKNDAAHFKQLFTKTQTDLARLQESIGALRQERHGLANDVMRGRGAEHMLKAVTEERDDLRKSIAEMQKREEEALELVRKREEEAVELVRKRDVQVAELTMQVAMLKDTFRQTQERLRATDAVARAPKTASVERFGDY